MFSRGHSTIWCDWSSGGESAPGVWEAGAPGHPLPRVVGNPYRLKAHLWHLQLSKHSALETEISHIWELRVPGMLLQNPWIQSCCLGLDSRSLGRNKESMSQGLHVPCSSPYCQSPFLFPELLGEDGAFPVGKCGVGRTGHLVHNSSPSLKPFCRHCCMLPYFIHASYGSGMYFTWGFTYKGTVWRGVIYCPSNLLSCLLQLFCPWWTNGLVFVVFLDLFF